MMTIKRLILTAAVAMCSLHLSAQETERRASLGLEYTTELQTSFRAANWVNLLQLDAGLRLGGGVSLEGKTISVAKTRDESLIGDLQVFSNIEETNLPLAFAVLGLGWEKEWGSGTTEIFIGARNVNEDYFTSPGTSLFTNSSCGIFPTISANYDIANYPLASLCIDLRQSWRDWTLQASVYNGQGYSRIVGQESIFHVSPKNDGVFGMAAANYDRGDSHYELGCAWHVLGRQASCAPWMNVEQRIGGHLHLIAQGSVNFAAALECRDYEALGLIAAFGRTETGLIVNHAAFREAHEWATELTCSISLSESLSLQPTIHLIRTGPDTRCVSLLRLSYAL